MSGNDATYRRIVRRETHSSRSAAGVVSALLLMLLAGGMAVLGGWWFFAQGSRPAIEGAIGGAPTQNGVDWLVLAGIAAAIVGIVLLIVAVTPGRLSRHSRVPGRTVHLVDDAAFADAIADRVAVATGVERSRVAVTVRPKRARVQVTPTSGLETDLEAAKRAAREVTEAVGFPLEVSAASKTGGQVS